MGYISINKIQQFNFQINRVLTYGDKACNPAEVVKATRNIKNLSQWCNTWIKLAQNAERENRILHSAYYYRMAEFFMKETDIRKKKVAGKSVKNFHIALQPALGYSIYEVPYDKSTLHAIKIEYPNAKKTIVVCGGFDSFVEEFILQVADFIDNGYNIILFEGPGQGTSLRNGLYFCPDWEKPTSAILDYFKIDNCVFVGISWGGYFALRAAAFEQRIDAAVAYDVMTDGMEVMTHVYPFPLGKIIHKGCVYKSRTLVDSLTSMIRKRSILADWALSQGMIITNTSSPYDFYQSLAKHSIYGLENKITANILLLAGEKDHYIPKSQYAYLCKSLPNAKSVTAKMFTKAEGGEQHCQIGNHTLAIETILNWLDTL